MTAPDKAPPLPRPKLTREKDAANDFLTDIGNFGEPLVFDEKGNLVSGPVAPPPKPTR